MLARSTLLLLALAALVAVANAAPLDFSEIERRAKDDKIDFDSAPAGPIGIAVFADSHYDEKKDYNAILAGAEAALAGKIEIKTFKFPANVAAVVQGVDKIKKDAKPKKDETAKLFVVAHGDAGAAVEAYLAGSTDAALAGAIFFGYLPTATSFAVPSQIVAGELDGVSTVDAVAYRFTDAAAANVHYAILEGVTNAHFANGVRKYATDIAPGNAEAINAARVRISLAFSSWINAITATRAVSFPNLLATAHLAALTQQTAAIAATWADARRQDLHEVCEEFEETFINVLPGQKRYQIQNYLAPDTEAYTASKSYIWANNNTVYVPTFIWTGPESPGALACKGKSRAQVAKILYPEVTDISTIFGPQLDGTHVHQKQFARAFALASAAAQARYTASGKSVSYVADDRSPANGPGYLASVGPFLARASANVFNARATIFASPDVCPVGTPPQFCTVDFLSAVYLKGVGVRNFLKFITIQALQD